MGIFFRRSSRHFRANAAMQLLDNPIALPIEMARKSGYLPVRPICEQ
jgi:hypothetical protein